MIWMVGAHAMCWPTFTLRQALNDVNSFRMRYEIAQAMSLDWVESGMAAFARRTE